MRSGRMVTGNGSRSRAEWRLVGAGPDAGRTYERCGLQASWNLKRRLARARIKAFLFLFYFSPDGSIGRSAFPRGGAGVWNFLLEMVAGMGVVARCIRSSAMQESERNRAGTSHNGQREIDRERVARACKSAVYSICGLIRKSASTFCSPRILVTPALPAQATRAGLLGTQTFHHRSRERKSHRGPGLPHRVVDAVDVVEVGLGGLDALVARAEQPVPEAGLLAIVVALLPALAVMEIVILDDELAVDQLQQPRGRAGGDDVHANTAVAKRFGEQQELETHPAVVEAHREAHELEHAVGEKRDTDHLDEFLLRVGVGGKHGVGVLGEMVRAVVFPQDVDLVARTMVQVEPAVENDRVEGHFDG
nr:hypothetical protein CFP56_50504 [Quercus suber]POF20065.1 hypothetical protein CFP56_52314 [Quercus suber]